MKGRECTMSMRSENTMPDLHYTLRTQSRTGPLQFDRLIPEKERQERCARIIQAAALFNCHADLLLLGLPRKSSQASHSWRLKK